MAEREVTFTIRVRDAATQALQQINGTAGKVTETMFGLGGVLKAITGVAAGFSLTAIIRDMAELALQSDKTFRLIAANLPTFTEGLRDLETDIKNLAMASGHAIDELEASALYVAQMGVKSNRELFAQLEAAAKLADSSGVSVNQAAELLIQLRREFGLTGMEAMTTAAKLRSIAQGRVGIDELAQAFVTAAPVFAKFRIDLDTGLKVIEVFAQKGIVSFRALRTAIDSIKTRAGFEYVASQAEIAPDTQALEDLDRAAKLVRESGAASATTIANEWHKVLSNLGEFTHFLEILQAIAKTLEQMANMKMPDLKGFLAAPSALMERKIVFGPRGQLQWAEPTPQYSMLERTRIAQESRIERPPLSTEDIRNIRFGLQLNAPPPPAPPKTSTVYWLPGTEPSAQRPPAPPPRIPERRGGAFDIVIPTTGEPKAAKSGRDASKDAERAREKLEDLRRALDALMATTEAAKPKSQEFGEQIAAWADSATDAKMPLDELARAVGALQNVQAAMRSQEAVAPLNERMAKQARDEMDAMKTRRQSFAELKDALAEFGDPLEKFDHDTAETLAKFTELGKGFKDGTREAADFQQGLENLRKHLGNVREGIVAATASAKRIREINEEIERGVSAQELSNRAIVAGVQSRKDLDKWVQKAKEEPDFQAKLAESLQAVRAQLAEQLAERDKLRERIKDAEREPAEQAKLEESLRGVLAVIMTLNQQWGLLVDLQAKQHNGLQDIINDMTTMGRTIVGASQALGVMNDRTASILQNAMNLGEGIGKAMAGGESAKGGWMEIIGSGAALITTLFGLGHSASQARMEARQLRASIDNLFAGLRAQIYGTATLEAQLEATRRQYEDARIQIEVQLGGKKKQTWREKELDELDRLQVEAEAKVRADFARRWREAEEDYQIRSLLARGLDADAAAARVAEEQEREYAQAVEDGATVQALAALKIAQADEAVKAAADIAAQAIEKLLEKATTLARAAIDVLDIADPLGQFREIAGAYKETLKGTLGGMLAGLDLTTIDPDAVQDFDIRLRELFTTFRETPDAVDLAGLTFDDFIDALTQLEAAADAVTDAIETDAERMQRLRGEIDAALSDLQMQWNVFGTSAADQLTQMSELFGFVKPSEDEAAKADRVAMADTLARTMGTAFDQLDAGMQAALEQFAAVVERQGDVAAAHDAASAATERANRLRGEMEDMMIRRSGEADALKIAQLETAMQAKQADLADAVKAASEAQGALARAESGSAAPQYMTKEEILALYTPYTGTPLTDEQRDLNKHIEEWLGVWAQANPARVAQATVDTYNQMSVGTVTGISAAEAGGILGRLDTANFHLGAIEDLLRGFSQTFSTAALGGSLMRPTWPMLAGGSATSAAYPGGATILQVVLPPDEYSRILDASPTLTAISRTLNRTRQTSGAPRTN